VNLSRRADDMTEQDQRKSTMSNYHNKQIMKIKEDYAALVPKLSQQDYESLKLSIKRKWFVHASNS
jgi:galactokinase/mevalonate kinase-like predicted kinase